MLATRRMTLFVLVLSSLIHVLQTAAGPIPVSVTYYITPVPADNGTCIVNDRIFTPCYQLYQLSPTLLSNRQHVTLKLLPGTHEISSDYSSSFNVSELEMMPAFGSGDIKCQQTQFVFLDGYKLSFLLPRNEWNWYCGSFS